MAVRPSWEGHLRLSLVTCPVALYPATTEAETVRFNLINPQTNNRIKMKTVDAGTGEEVSRGDLVKGFEIAKGEYVLFAKEELDAVKLEIDAHHRHREVRAARLDRSPVLGHALPSRADGQDRHRSLCRHPRRHGQAEQAGDRPPRDEHPRARLRHRDRGRRAGAQHPAHGRGGSRPRRHRQPRPAQARSADAADRREDRRAAVGRVRSQRVPRPLRGRPARADRAEAQGQAGQAVGQAGQRRHQGHRPHGGAQEEPGRRRRAAAGRPAGNKKKPNGRRAA